MDTASSIDAVPKPKHNLLPVLIFLFLVSYGLLTLLVVEQDRTIASQRTTIKQLLSDSGQLAAAKGNAGSSQTPSRPHSKTQTPSGREGHKDSRRSHHNARPMPKFLPEKPPVPASDASDERRAPVSI
jgi:hypothetical protein